MVHDRTFEFRSTIDIISGGQTTLTGSSGYLSNLKTNQFLEKATAITSDLSKNSLKLEQLTKLAKNRSIFEDKPQEFNDLSNLIKRDLSLLNRRIQELKNEINQGNISGDNTLRNRNNSENEHQKNVTIILQNWTAQSFKSFENILELQSQTLKSKKDRKDQFGSGTSDGMTSFLNSTFRSTTPPASYSSNQQNNKNNNNNNNLSTKQRPIDPSLKSNFNTQQSSAELNSFVAQAPVKHIDQSSTLNKKFDDQSHVAIDFSQQQQQQTLMMEQEPLLGTDSRNLRSRNNALGAIESTINELGSIYQQLAHMVAEQGETVQRIDMNIEDLNTNVLSGQNQLARYLRTVSSNRWLVAKMFLAFILFIIIFKFLFLR